MCSWANLSCWSTAPRKRGPRSRRRAVHGLSEPAEPGSLRADFARGLQRRFAVDLPRLRRRQDDEESQWRSTEYFDSRLFRRALAAAVRSPPALSCATAILS